MRQPYLPMTCPCIHQRCKVRFSIQSGHSETAFGQNFWWQNPSVLTFDLFNYRVSDIISRNFQILKNDPETSAIFTDNPLICFRRNRNIRDDLVRSALRQNVPVAAGSFSRSCARCYICSSLNSATSISWPQSNFVIGHNFTCTSYIIYCISCSKCCKLYIGETGRRLSVKFSEHLRSVRNWMILRSLLCDILLLQTAQFPI